MQLIFLSYYLALYIWLSLLQVEVEDDPTETKKDDQDDQTEVHLLLFVCSEKYLDQHQKLA